MSDDRIMTELAAVLAALGQARAERAEILGRLENVEATAKIALEEVRSLDRVCSRLLVRVGELDRLRVDVMARFDGLIEQIEALRAEIEALQPPGPHQTGV